MGVTYHATCSCAAANVCCHKSSSTSQRHITLLAHLNTTKLCQDHLLQVIQHVPALTRQTCSACHHELDRIINSSVATLHLFIMLVLNTYLHLLIIDRSVATLNLFIMLALVSRACRSMGVLLRSLRLCLTSEGQQAVLAAIICLLVLHIFPDSAAALQVRAK